MPTGIVFQTFLPSCCLLLSILYSCRLWWLMIDHLIGLFDLYRWHFDWWIRIVIEKLFKLAGEEYRLRIVNWWCFTTVVDHSLWYFYLLIRYLRFTVSIRSMLFKILNINIWLYLDISKLFLEEIYLIILLRR